MPTITTPVLNLLPDSPGLSHTPSVTISHNFTSVSIFLLAVRLRNLTALYVFKIILSPFDSVLFALNISKSSSSGVSAPSIRQLWKDSFSMDISVSTSVTEILLYILLISSTSSCGTASGHHVREYPNASLIGSVSSFICLCSSFFAAL